MLITVLNATVAVIPATEMTGKRVKVSDNRGVEKLLTYQPYPSIHELHMAALSACYPAMFDAPKLTDYNRKGATYTIRLDVINNDVLDELAHDTRMENARDDWDSIAQEWYGEDNEQ